MTIKTDKVLKVSNNSRDYLQACYLDYLNNFISCLGYAQHYGISQKEAQIIIDAGKRIQEERAISNRWNMIQGQRRAFMEMN